VRKELAKKIRENKGEGFDRSLEGEFGEGHFTDPSGEEPGAGRRLPAGFYLFLKKHRDINKTCPSTLSAHQVSAIY